MMIQRMRFKKTLKDALISDFSLPKDTERGRLPRVHKI